MNALGVLALEGNANQKEGSILCALKWGEWRAEVPYGSQAVYVLPGQFM